MILWWWTNTTGFYFLLNFPEMLSGVSQLKIKFKQHSKDRLHISAFQLKDAWKQLKLPKTTKLLLQSLISIISQKQPLNLTTTVFPQQLEIAVHWLQRMTLLLRFLKSCSFITQNKLKKNQHSTAPKTEQDKNCAKITKICTHFSVWRNVQ